MQELIPGGNIYIMNNPVGPVGQDLYLNRSAGVPVANVGVRLYNVGTGTLSNYDNLYAVVPEPSTVGLLLAGLSGLGLVRRRKK